jgi:hypothetical protein
MVTFIKLNIPFPDSINGHGGPDCNIETGNFKMRNSGQIGSAKIRCVNELDNSANRLLFTPLPFKDKDLKEIFACKIF